MPQQSTISALLATGRISNLPTVWCNVLVAFLWISFSKLHLLNGSNSTLSLTLLLTTSLAASLLYVGGCFLGDAVDVEFDSTHKPTRPIPTGQLSRQSVYTAACCMLTAGTILPLAYIYFNTGSCHPAPTLATLLLSASIIAYSIWHKKSPWIGLPLIGACRFFVIIFAAHIANAVITGHNATLDIRAEYTATQSGLGEVLTTDIYFIALAVAIYTICFASVARSESSPKPISWRKFLIATMVILPLVLIEPLFTIITNLGEIQQQSYFSSILKWATPTLTALFIYWVWMITAFLKINTNKGRFVSMSLAGFCLLDTCFASIFGWQWLITCLILFALSLFLQKWAPAT